MWWRLLWTELGDQYCGLTTDTFVKNSCALCQPGFCGLYVQCLLLNSHSTWNGSRDDFSGNVDFLLPSCQWASLELFLLPLVKWPWIQQSRSAIVRCWWQIKGVLSMALNRQVAWSCQCVSQKLHMLSAFEEYTPVKPQVSYWAGDFHVERSVFQELVCCCQGGCSVSVLSPPKSHRSPFGSWTKALCIIWHIQHCCFQKEPGFCH